MKSSQGELADHEDWQARGALRGGGRTSRLGQAGGGGGGAWVANAPKERAKVFKPPQ